MDMRSHRRAAISIPVHKAFWTVHYFTPIGIMVAPFRVERALRSLLLV
jgi:hypothetical protein